MEELINLFGKDNDNTNIMDAPHSLCFPPEPEEGNMEYKLKLVHPTASRFEHLVTQLKWRLQEGQGEAIYEIGIEDNGTLAGLSEEDLDASIKTLHNMATTLGAAASVLRRTQVENTNRSVAEVLVRKVPENQQFIDMRLAVLGAVDSGKSTLLGVLTQGELDNGRGRARLNLFRHLHEIQTGRTSCISHEILGFDKQGKVVNYSESRTLEEIIENSTKLITLIDLCGHQKYIKTTIFGLTGYSPDFALLVVSAVTGVVATTREHLGYAVALRVPVFVVVTKADMCLPIQLDKTIRQVEHLLKLPGCNRIPARMEENNDVTTAASHFHTQSVCPIFTISNQSGQGLPLLTSFLNLLPPLWTSKDRELHMQQHTEHQIDEVYQLQGVGVVVYGAVTRGVIREGDSLLLGPTDDGRYVSTKVTTIRRNRLASRLVSAGQTASLCLGHFDGCPVRKGMVLVSPMLHPEACQEFEADVFVLYHGSKSISKNFQTVVHVNNVMQTAIIVKLSQDNIKTNEKATVTFHFINRPEYIQVGSRLLFHEGRTKGMGEVTRIFAYSGAVER